MIVTIVLLVILALFTVLGLKKGLIRTVLTLIGNIAAFYIARKLADWITPIIAGEIPLPGIGTSLTSALNRAELAERSLDTVTRVLTEYGFPPRRRLPSRKRSIWPTRTVLRYRFRTPWIFWSPTFWFSPWL